MVNKLWTAPKLFRVLFVLVNLMSSPWSTVIAVQCMHEAYVEHTRNARGAHTGCVAGASPSFLCHHHICHAVSHSSSMHAQSARGAYKERTRSVRGCLSQGACLVSSVTTIYAIQRVIAIRCMYKAYVERMKSAQGVCRRGLAEFPLSPAYMPCSES